MEVNSVDVTKQKKYFIPQELVGKRIKECREEKGMTQEELGQLLGYNKSTIQRYEAGLIRSVKIPALQAIANALNVNPDYLALKSDDKTPITLKNAFSQATSSTHSPLGATKSNRDLRIIPYEIPPYEQLDSEGRELFRAITEYIQRLQEQYRVRAQVAAAKATNLTQLEYSMLELFRRFDEERQKKIIDLIETFLYSGESK